MAALAREQVGVAKLAEEGIDVEVVDPTWIDVAYTWSWPGPQWRQTALSETAKHNIYQIGRYGQWNFQGIAESLKEGSSILSSIKSLS